MESDNLYFGQTRNGLYHGRGTLLCTNEKYTTSSIINDNFKPPYYTFRWYTGRFQDGQFHGYGNLLLQYVASDWLITDFKFVGEFDNGKPKSNSIFRVEVTDVQQPKKPLIVYTGHLSSDYLFHGQGTVTSQRGKFVGSFQNGDIHGQGQMYYLDNLLSEGFHVHHYTIRRAPNIVHLRADEYKLTDGIEYPSDKNIVRIFICPHVIEYSCGCCRLPFLNKLYQYVQDYKQHDVQDYKQHDEKEVKHSLTVELKKMSNGMHKGFFIARGNDQVVHTCKLRHFFSQLPTYCHQS